MSVRPGSDARCPQSDAAPRWYSWSMRRAAVVSVPGFVLAILLLAACSGNDPSRPRALASWPPTACFTVTPWRPLEACPYRVLLLFEASCSTDDSTAVNDLRVRWDFDDDGRWDTGFGPVADTVVFDPGVLDGPNWNASCEVRDTDGGSGTFGLWFRIPGLGEPPDVLAGPVAFETREPRAVNVTTVRAGQEFAVDVYAGFFGLAAGESLVVAIERNGAPFARETAASFRNTCGGFGLGWYTVAEPGQYEFTVILDADGAIAETDETNNRAAAVLTVLP